MTRREGDRERGRAGAGERFVIAGHGLVEAARRLGWVTLRAADMSGVWTERQALAYLAADNELARAADPDEAALGALVGELAGFDGVLAKLAAGGEERLQDLLAEAKPVQEDPGAQVDKAEELREKWGTETGQDRVTRRRLSKMKLSF